ncbi:MAG TPA: ABC transporter permease [Cyclobacteriaceae bacterium]|nr:ABC transporter permease [Cyclobacteriaceae bacterium]
MLRSYLKTGFRHLLRNKSDAFINTGGLALGISIAILIGLWVNDELTFNQYHKNHERIAKVFKWTGQEWLPYPLAVELKENYHQSFKHVVVADNPHDFIISSGEQRFNARGEFADTGIAEMLSLEMIEGDWSGLTDPHSVMLSESMARSFFGNESALGKLARINNLMDVTVTGVYKDIPHNSNFAGIRFFAPFDLLIIQYPGIRQATWDDHWVFVYTELAPHMTFEQVAPLIEEAESKVIRNLDYMKAEAAENPKVWLHPMDKWHLYSDFSSNGPIQFVVMVGAIGVFVLLLACINFMNLATARSEKRMREVGIRKSIGSLRSQLVGQFFSESFIVVILAFVMAIVFASLALPAFNELSGKEMAMPWLNISYWLSAIILIVITGIVAGSYPALYLSSFRPAAVLKGQNRVGKLATFLRRGLVTVQFTVSISLIIATIVVYKQIIFAKNREVGYSRAGLMMVPGRAFNGKYDVIREELLKTGVVENVATAGGQVTSAWSQGGGFEWRGKVQDPPAVGTLEVNNTFGATVGWKIIAGRDFEEGVASDSNAFIINEAAARMMGFDAPVGEVVHWKSKWHRGGVDSDFRIIGVVSDLMMKSPFDNIMPAVFFLQKDFGVVHIRLAGSSPTSEAISKIEKAFRKAAPEVPFEYSFADEEYNQKFAYEERIGKLASVFSVLAIVISCLGLFGMASFMTERRTKEIGVRKVVGASVFSLWQLMSREFVALAFLSFVIASAISFYALDQWLQSFTLRTDLSWDVFAVAGAGSLFVTLLTVSYRLLQAANRNPVNSLRSE